MTCIVGIETDTSVILAADSQATMNGDTRVISREDKIFSLAVDGEPLLLGVAGDFRISQLLHYRWTPPTTGKLQDLAYVVSAASSIRELLRREACLTTEDRAECMNASILVGFRGMLFAIHSDFSAISRQEGYDAIGSGSPFALGALYALEQDLDFEDKRSAEFAARLAIKAASVFDVSCGGEIVVRGCDDVSE